MFALWQLFAILLAYLGLLFFIAQWGDRRAERGQIGALRPWVYSLALAVYCTSWTFYGAVGRASDQLWSYLPIYLGPILVFVFGMPLVRRLVQWAHQQHLTSVADLIAARYGRDRTVATLATLVCVVAVVPYIALQLQGVALGFDVLAVDIPGVGRDVSAFLTASALATFAILFGTRHVSSRESHQGLLVAIGFESLVKLAAFVVVGLLCWWSLEPGQPLISRQQPALSQAWLDSGFITQTLLAGIAILCLPRQFHVMAVEYTDTRELRLARWLFPLYLGLVAVLVLPIVATGPTLLGYVVNPDAYVLLVPMALDQPLVSLLVFVGGVSAASAMVIVSTIALSTMVSNEIIIPRYIGIQALQQPGDHAGFIKRVRRVTIVVILALAYGFYLLMAAGAPLAATGLLAFVGIAQLAPALFGGLFWSGARRQGAVWGLGIGAVIWAWTLVLPALLPEAREWRFEAGLLWLSPSSFLGLDALDPVTRAGLASLLLNILAFVIGSRRESAVALRPSAPEAATLSMDQAVRILTPFFGSAQAHEVLTGGAGVAPYAAPESVAGRCERLLSGVIGAATARRLVREVAAAPQADAETVLRHTSGVVEFSRDLLQASLDNTHVAVSVVDSNQRLVAWNSLYQQLFGFPPELLHVGTPIERLVRFNAERGLLGSGESEELVQTRLEHLRSGTRYRHERELPDGRFLEIRGAPMPGGGFITTFADVTEYKRLQQQLQRRVSDRTAELEQANAALSVAKAAADEANQSKTRFLAAATHDLMQPLNAARLFSAVLLQGADPQQTRDNAAQIEQSLDSMEHLLSTLLDISKIDAGVLPMRISQFVADELLDGLRAQFDAEARQRHIDLRVRPCSAVIRTDAQHLRRILQNFVSNALRYVPAGGSVLVGCRRYGSMLRFEVCDNGPGIPRNQQERVFEEFQRGRQQDPGAPRGAGLGLSISRRLAAMLELPISLRSEPGRGSAFCIGVPRAQVADRPKRAPLGPNRDAPARRFDGLTVLCLDNEPLVLAGMRRLLSSWGCTVLEAQDHVQAMAVSAERVPDIVLVDFHLDEERSGIQVLEQLVQEWGRRPPAALITADYTDDARQAAQAADMPLLRKPLKPAALGAVVARLRAAAGRGVVG